MLYPELTQDYIFQVSEEIKGRVTKKLSKEFSQTESRILGALSKLDEFLLNPQVRTCSVAVPGTSRNNNSEIRETTGDRSSDYPCPDLRYSSHHSGHLNSPEAEDYTHSSTVVLSHGVGLSSSEAEYQGLVPAAQEALFFRDFLCDLQQPQQQPTSLGEDNQSAIKLSTNPVFYKRSKQIDLKQRFLRLAVQKDEINISHEPNQKMAADTFTKGVCEAKITEHCENIMGRLNPTCLLPVESEWEC